MVTAYVEALIWLFFVDGMCERRVEAELSHSLRRKSAKQGHSFVSMGLHAVWLTIAHIVYSDVVPVTVVFTGSFIHVQPVSVFVTLPSGNCFAL